MTTARFNLPSAAIAPAASRKRMAGTGRQSCRANTEANSAMYPCRVISRTISCICLRPAAMKKTNKQVFSLAHTSRARLVPHLPMIEYFFLSLLRCPPHGMGNFVVRLRVIQLRLQQECSGVELLRNRQVRLRGERCAVRELLLSHAPGFGAQRH